MFSNQIQPSARIEPIKDRVILHCDMNNFYANVECLFNPAIKDRAVAVCGDAELRHGIVLAKNAIAKSYGVATGDVIWQARQKCADIVVVKANFGRYIEYSRRAREIYNRYTDQIESYGIDECWLDVSGSVGLFGGGEEIANRLREEIKRELGLTISVGVSFNKVFAKLGSDLKKPDATTIITRESLESVVYPLAVDNLLFAGRRTVDKLNRLGIRTIGDLASYSPESMREKLGKMGERLWLYARGLDSEPVARCGQERCVKSVSNSTTCPKDLTSRAEVLSAVAAMAESVATRLRERNLKGRVVYLSLRDSNLEWWSKQHKLSQPTNLAREIFGVTTALFDNCYKMEIPIRGVGVGVSDICQGYVAQTTIFENEHARQKQERLERSLDKIRSRYGAGAVRLASAPLTGLPDTKGLTSSPAFMSFLQDEV